MGVLRKLQEKSKEVEWGNKNRKEFFAVVAKNGFDSTMIKLAKKEGVVLIERDGMLSP